MTQSVVRNETRAFQSIQYLRALAALMVVVFHVRPRLVPMGYAGGWPGWLSCGVDIFFVISGFIMWTTTCDRPIGPAAFFARRFLRIAPLYYLVTAVVIGVMLAAPALVSSGRFDRVHALASFAFVPHLNDVTASFDPVLPQGWTLNYEMAFYALFAIALFAAIPLRQVLILAMLVVVAGVGLFAPRMSVLGFYTDSIVLEFGFGIVIALAVGGGWRLSFGVALVTAVAGAVAIVLTWPIVTSGVPRVWLSGVGAALLVLGAVNCELTRGSDGHRALRLLGDASYSIYLTHGLVITAVAVVWTRLRLGAGPGGMAAFSVLAVVAATIGGIIVYQLAERPLHDLARRLTRRRRAGLAPQPSRIAAEPSSSG